MHTQTGFRPWVKALLFWAVFMALYVLQKVAPVFPITLIAGVDESNFQHYKATFYAYLITCLIEYLVFRGKVENKPSFWYARLTASLFAPWLVFLTWYVMAAMFGRLPNVILEILYGNIATLAVGVFAAMYELNFEQIQFSKPLQTLTWMLLTFSIIIFTLLTFKLPWADVFTEPNWKESTSLFWRFHV